VRATEQFLAGPNGHGGKVDYDEGYMGEGYWMWKMRERGVKYKKWNEQEEEKKGGKLCRPIGRPGELALHHL
jgi:platelet-activating factor acetylhydrolase